MFLNLIRNFLPRILDLCFSRKLLCSLLFFCTHLDLISDNIVFIEGFWSILSFGILWNSLWSGGIRYSVIYKSFIKFKSSRVLFWEFFWLRELYFFMSNSESYLLAHRQTTYTLSNLPLTLLCLYFGTINLLFISVDLTLLNIWHEQNNIIC